MKIIIADPSGFCFGVSRAIDLAEKAAGDHGQVESLGKIIHNSDEVSRLVAQGVNYRLDKAELTADRPVIIRSHGETKAVVEGLLQTHPVVIDATCPFVSKLHRDVDRYSKDHRIILLGNKDHPEIIGAVGWGHREVDVVNSLDELKALPLSDEPTVLLAQTTLREDFFQAAEQYLGQNLTHLKVENTICSATKNRQQAAVDLAKQADAMIVLGGKESSNTKKLVELCQTHNPDTFWFENSSEINVKDFEKYDIIGISAGASTPGWVIDSVVETLERKAGVTKHMDNSEMKNLMEQSSFIVPKKNEVLKGKVVMIKDDGVVVNVGYKADGILPTSEISNPENKPLDELFQVDEEIDVLVLKREDADGEVLLSSKRLRSRKDWEVLEEKFNNKETITVKVTEVVKGGLSAYYHDIRAFIPASHVDTGFVRDLSQFVDQEIEVGFLDFDRRKNQIVLTRKEVLEKDLAGELDEFWENIEVGQVLTGTVRRFTNYGAFVELGPTDGLLHVSEIQWGKVNKPSDVLKVNQELEFKVIDFDKSENKISLSRKQLVPDPWVVIDDNYHVGERYDGKVVSLTDFGAFIELEPGLEGLIHVSQISEDRVEVPSDVLNVGEEVVVKILDIDKEERRIKLSMKEL